MFELIELLFELGEFIYLLNLWYNWLKWLSDLYFITVLLFVIICHFRVRGFLGAEGGCIFLENIEALDFDKFLEGVCIIEDDFPGLVDAIAAADAVVFATPVYFGDLSESLRAFLDRLRRVCMHEAGKAKVEGKPALGICVAGGGGGGAPACAQSLDKIVDRCGFDLVDVIPVRRQNLEMKRDILRATGTWPVFRGA